MMNDVSIKSVTIKGFRNLKCVENLELSNLNVLIGGNGVGKSTLMHFFEMLSWMHQGSNFQEYVIRNGGGDDQFFMGGLATPEMTADISMETKDGTYDYGVSLVYLKAKDRAWVTEERYRFVPPASEEAVPYQVLKEMEAESQLGRQTDPTAQKIRKLLQQFGVFHFYDAAANATANKRWEVSDSYCLHPDGGNLAPVLLSLKENDRQRYQYIVDQIQSVFPNLGDFVLTQEYGKVLLQWKHRFSNKVLGPYLTSDGTLRFFFLVTLLNLPSDRLPSVLFIDEPELGLHPYAMELVAAMLKRVARTKQVVVATQSANLLDCFDLDNIIVAESHGGAAQFKRMNRQDYERWLEDDYQPSDIWLSQSVGGGL